MTRDQFFDKKAKGALWDVGVSIKRGNPLPIDADSVFASLAEAETYAAGVLAYPGQVLAVVDTDATTIYYIDQAMALQEVGKIPVGDGKSIAVAEDGTISILGLAEADTGAQLVKKADGTVEWVKPDTTTVEGLTTEVANLNNRATALETAVGDATKGLVKDVADVRTDLSNNYYDKTSVDNLVSGAFHFKGTATLEMTDGTWTGNLLDADSKVISGKAGDVYQVGDKEYAYNGKAWIELGFTLDLSAYATTASVTTAINNAKTELQTYTDTAESDAVASAKTYTDTQLESYSKTTDIDNKISAAKTELQEYADTAEADAITTAGTNADAKISAAIGDLGDKATVRAYVDAADATLQNSITELEGTVGGLNLKALAHKDQVEETDLAEALATKINGKADKATTLEGYGITDAMTKTAIEGAISTAKSEAITDAEGKIATAKNEVIGTDLDESTDDTVKGAKKYADEVANKSTTDVIGTDKDASTKNTIYGVRKYTDEQVANATSTAANALKPVSDKANANEAAIAVINGSGEGSITKAVADAKTELTTAIEAKQDKLTFTSTPDATNNKVVTQSYVDSNFAKLSGAMHYIGTAQSDPLAVNTHDSPDSSNWTMGDITVTNGSDTITTFHVGDVVSYGIKEYVCENTTEHPHPDEVPCTVKYTWRELGTEGSYAVKGSISDEDISSAANISVDKINDTELTRKITDLHYQFMGQEGVKDPDNNSYSFDFAGDGYVTLPFATAAKAGLVKVGSELEISSTGVLGIKELNVTKLVQSDEDTIIINCGDSNR